MLKKREEAVAERTFRPGTMSATVKPIRIVVADDHLVYRIGVRNLLGSEPGFEVVGEASDGLQAVELFRRLLPDVLLLDLRMPARNGIEVVQTLRGEYKSARILIVTSYQTEEEIFQVLQAGALGYVIKDVGRDTLIEAVRTVAAGSLWLSPVIQRQFANRMHRPDLTAREMDILRLLARGLTNREIADVHNISANTVKNHLNSLMAKLEVADRTEAVSFCLARGILHSDEL